MSRKLLAGTVLLGAGILTLVFGLNSPKPVYARSVSEFLARPLREQPVRINGVLVPGSLCRARNSCEYRFRMAAGAGWSRVSDAGPLGPSPELSVHYSSCFVPDTLRDVPGMEVPIIVEGELCANCHRFEASQLLIKCPGKYWMKTDGGPPCPASKLLQAEPCAEH